MAINYLDYTQRQGFPRLLELMAKAYRDICGREESGWGIYNGESDYALCGVDDYALIKKIINLQYKIFGQKEFYFMDIGCGNFQWSHGVADYINAQKDLPNDIKVHIIGIRGERYLGKRVEERDRCKIYNLGAFKIENLFEDFKKQFEIDLENKMDFIVSRWCLRHLADPTGTVLQIVRLLRPEGLFAFDGFHLLHEKDNLEVDFDSRITQLFLDMKIPFLTHYYSMANSLNHFILQKPSNYSCRLPMKYHSVCEDVLNRTIGAECITRFIRNPLESEKFGFQYPKGCHNRVPFSTTDKIREFFGDQKLYNWLKDNDLFTAKETRLRPLKIPLLHSAVFHGDIQEFKSALSDGVNVYECDEEGRTPLHVAIDQGRINFFCELLPYYKNFEYQHPQSHHLLHYAASYDKKGSFIKAVLQAGADINSGIEQEKTPLAYAIDQKNLAGIEVLIRTGATITSKNKEALSADRQTFSSLYREGIIAEEKVPQEEGCIQQIFKLLQKGDCVLLREDPDPSTWVVYNYSEASDNLRCLAIDLNHPFNRVLTESELLGWFAAYGHKYITYDERKMAAIQWRSGVVHV